MFVMTRLRRAFGITAFARITKSRGNETLTTSYCRLAAGIRSPHLTYGIGLLTVFHNKAEVNQQLDRPAGPHDSAERAGAGG
jgi:hypothetical protein